jgi:hypothetical protein
LKFGFAVTCGAETCVIARVSGAGAARGTQLAALTPQI